MPRIAVTGLVTGAAIGMMMASMTKVGLAELVGRALGGRDPESERALNPSDFYRLLNDPFAVWCDFHAPAAEREEVVGRMDRLKMEWGREFEVAWCREHHPDAVEIDWKSTGENLKATMEAMRKGAKVIHAPQLWLLGEDLRGQGDLLIRARGRSDLGAYHYRVCEVKRRDKLATYHILQGVAYNRIVGAIQGYTPREVEFVTGGRRTTVPYADWESKLVAMLGEWRALRDGGCKPEVPVYGRDDKSEWTSYARKLLAEARHVASIPGITAARGRKLLQLPGVKTADDLARLTLGDFQRALGKSGGGVYYRYQAHRAGKPVLAPGAKLDIRRGRRHLYLDFETSDTHPTISSHVYMIGWYDAEEDRYDCLVAKGPADEERIFAEFCDRFAPFDGIVLYHWTNFELGQIDAVAARHPALAPRLKAMKSACFDLKAAVDDKVYFGAQTYSLKEVAPFLGFRWRLAEVDAMESMALYWEWLVSEEAGWIDRVKTYNEDDCRGMKVVEERVLAAAGGR